MNSQLAQFAEQGELVVLSGAGVSMIAPSALPGWKPLNQLITAALRGRLEAALERPDYVEKPLAGIDASREADRFPPDYQAQIIHEMCGHRYFELLQALDVDATNAAHDGLAALAQAGKIKALVTTNFDRLLEKALERRGVAFQVACEDAGFLEIAAQLREGGLQSLPIIKIHGCVSRPDSMIDTLKQRRRSRSSALSQCLEPLFPHPWLYLGFSAADLEDNPQYLGLVEGAASSIGATFLTRSREKNTGNPKLGVGARTLMDAYDSRGQIEVGDAGQFATRLGEGLGLDVPAFETCHEETGLAIFRTNLEAKVAGLSVSATGLCLAALLEADRQAESAAYLLDRLVRKELREEKDTDDFRALQFHYGRLGAAWGRFIRVPDSNGIESNASAESVQSLMRLLCTDWKFSATGCLAPTFLWLNRGEEATQIALKVLVGVGDNHWEGVAPRNDEEIVDAWVCAAQVCIVNTGQATAQLVVTTAAQALDCARRCGDVVRTARVIAFYLLALSQTSQNVPALAETYRGDFEAAARVGDGFAQGMRALALGTWFGGDGGRALTFSMQPDDISLCALKNLDESVRFFQRQGMDPWVLFALSQKAKVFADLNQFETATICLRIVEKGVERFPIFKSHLLEALSQVQLLAHDDQALPSLQAAVQAAHDSGLFARRELLNEAYLRLNPTTSPSAP